MKSLIVRASRSATPVNSISTKSFIAGEGIDNPESKPPMIRQSSSLTVWKENLPMVRKISAIELYKPNFPQYIKEDGTLETQEKNPLTLLSEYKAEIKENSNSGEDEITFKNKIAVMLDKFLYGTPPKFKTEHEKNYYYRSLAFFASIASRTSAEQDLEISPEKRFMTCSDSELKVFRHDKKPNNKIILRKNFNNSNKTLSGPKGEQIYSNIITYFSKSVVDSRGKIIPVSALNPDIFSENFPKELANIVYKHVADTNKAVVQQGYEFDSFREYKAQDRSNMLKQLERMEPKASPLTSAARNPSRPALFKKWGKPGEHIEIDAAKVRILSTDQIVNLILFAADDEHANQNTSFKWREHKKELWDEKSLQETEKLLIEHGVDPNGDWTERELTAYYTLVAGEWLIIGATSEDVAKIVHKS